jgi:hypothetical protein
MKFERTDQFVADFKALPAPDRDAFRSLIPAFHAAALSYVADPGTFRWPAALRVKPLASAKGIWEMTLSFSGPDGRATFEFVTDDDGIRVRWRRIGTHTIYKKP